MEQNGAPAAGQIKSLVRLDEQYRRALAIAIEAGRASVSMIQRKMNIRYSEAQDLVVRMLRDGLVSIEDTPGVPTEIARAALPSKPLPLDESAVFTIWQGMQYKGGIFTQQHSMLFARQVLEAHGYRAGTDGATEEPIAPQSK